MHSHLETANGWTFMTSELDKTKEWFSAQEEGERVTMPINSLVGRPLAAFRTVST